MIQNLLNTNILYDVSLTYIVHVPSRPKKSEKFSITWSDGFLSSTCLEITEMF